MTPSRILVAGIGNIFHGDDGFGSEVARRLQVRPRPEGVTVADFGIRGFDLACALMDGYDAAILIDVVRRGGAPGTVYVIEPDVRAAPGGPALETHGMNPARVLDLVRSLGGSPPCLRLIGCEPAILGTEDEVIMGLSGPVTAALEPAIQRVESLVAELRAEAPRHA
jgi:hydrogenase maturation protease